MWSLSVKKIVQLSFSLFFIVFILLCRWIPGLAEWYMRDVYPAVAGLLSFISSSFFFSMFDILIIGFIVGFFINLIVLIVRRNKFGKWLYELVIGIVGIIIWFYMSWGISYFRDDFYARTDTPKAAFDTLNFKSFLNDYITELNAAYIPVSDIDYHDVDSAIEKSYEKLQDELQIPYPNGTRRVKKMIFEKFITKAGVSGYFGPFFNEVHVNRYPLAYEQPSTIAHEKAHQFGVASEAECNLYAYIVCTTSDNRQVRYSGYLEALGYILSNARKLLPDEYMELRNKINPKILEDYSASYEHWQEAINPTVSEVQHVVYDAYLKSNKIKSGVSNYSEMVALLVSWHNAKKLIID